MQQNGLLADTDLDPVRILRPDGAAYPVSS